MESLEENAPQQPGPEIPEGCSLEGLVDTGGKHEMGRLEAKLEALRTRIIEKLPWTESFVSGFDIKVGIAQGVDSLASLALMNALFACTAASYVGIQALTYGIGSLLLIGTYFAAHYLLNDGYRQKKKELLYDALRFTGISCATFLPMRLLSFGIENLLVYTGLSRYIVGNVVPNIILSFQSLAANRSGKELHEGKSVVDALKDGFINMPRDLGAMAGYVASLAVKGIRAGWAYLAERYAPANGPAYPQPEICAPVCSDDGGGAS